MDQQVQQEAPTPRPRNTVTLSLDGDNAQCVENYRRAIGHYRAWNRYNGIRVNVSTANGGNREIYTTPPTGTFYFVVRYAGRKLHFVLQARSGWMVGFYGQNGVYQLTLDEQESLYMNRKDCKVLSFKGNHRYISDGDPGNTLIGLPNIRKTFQILWALRGQDPESHQLRRAFGVFVVFLCEGPKNQVIFDRICRSFLDPSISRLDAQDGVEMQLGDSCQHWSKLSQEGMINVEYRVNRVGQVIPPLNNYGIDMIATAEDILRIIRILHRDGYSEGLFTHEPIPSPPQQWEPIYVGEGDSSEEEIVSSSDDDDSDDEYQRKGGRKKEKKYEKRRRTPNKIIRYDSKEKRGSGGEAINFPDHLINSWNTLPIKKAEEIIKHSFPAIRKLPNLQKLTLVGCIGIDDDAHDDPEKECSKSLQNITDVGVSSALKLPNLLEPDLSLCCSDKECSKSLQVLDLSHCQNITHVGVSSILMSVPNLLERDLSFCCPVTTSMVRSFQRIPKLRTFKLEGCRFMTDRLKAIGTSCVSLRELSLSKCSGVTDTELSFVMSRLKNSLKLDITCRTITDVSLAAITSPCTSFISLRMESNSHVSSQALQLIGKHCSHLEELDLTDSDLDQGLKALSRCSELLSLKIDICLKISDEGLTHVGRCCPELRDIDLYRCGGLSDDGIIQNAQGWPMLESINLSYCTEITDRSLIALSNCTKLHEALKSMMPAHLIKNVEARGCVFQWINKPFKVEVDLVMYGSNSPKMCL